MNNQNFNQPLVLRPKSFGEENFPKKKRRFSFKKIFIWVIVLISIYFLVVFGLQIFNAYQTKSNAPTTEQILNAIRGEIILPTNEEPVIKTVTNLEEVKYQPFFMNAEVGDQVIIYSVAKKAILFRPSTNKIIEASNLQ